MRLICPNCDAQYEVDDSVIPENGRDVQCSNCGHTWFQDAANKEFEDSPELILGPETTETAPQAEDAPIISEPEVEISGEPDPVEAPAEERFEAPEEPEPEDSAAEKPAPAAEPVRSTVDESIINVLREEAELEQQARSQEGRGAAIESQPDLGLEESAAAPRKKRSGLQERMARLRGIDTEETVDVHDNAAGSRRDLLPDVEEINSTLRATSERHSQEQDPGIIAIEQDVDEPQGRSGFGRGFSVMILLAVILLGIYVLAPKIVAMAPPAEPALNAYVATIDQARLALDNQLRALVDVINKASE